MSNPRYSRFIDGDELISEMLPNGIIVTTVIPGHHLSLLDDILALTGIDPESLEPFYPVGEPR